MKICGVELKSNNIIISIVDILDDEINYIDIKTKKLILKDDENRETLLAFSNEINKFLKENSIEKINIKKRAKKGNFAGGVVTFKIEALIQLNNICEVNLVSSQALAKFQKKHEIEFPSTLTKYQEQSYLSALALDI